MKISCPYCGQCYEVDEEFLGEVVNCQQCDKAFVIQEIEESCLENKDENFNVTDAKRGLLKRYVFFVLLALGVPLTVICIVFLLYYQYRTKAPVSSLKKIQTASAIYKEAKSLQQPIAQKTNAENVESKKIPSAVSKEAKQQKHSTGCIFAIGPKQNITDDMGFEELCNALQCFYTECKCEDVRNKFPWFWGLNRPSNDIAVEQGQKETMQEPRPIGRKRRIQHRQDETPQQRRKKFSQKEERQHERNSFVRRGIVRREERQRIYEMQRKANPNMWPPAYAQDETLPYKKKRKC